MAMGIAMANTFGGGAELCGRLPRLDLVPAVSVNSSDVNVYRNPDDLTLLHGSI
jgi:hypothetical protein